MADAAFGSEDDRDNQEWLQHARRGDYERAWQVSDRVLRRHIGLSPHYCVCSGRSPASIV